MKVIECGPESIHLLRYCEMMRGFSDLSLIGLTEKNHENIFVDESFCVSFRGNNAFKLLRNYFRLKDIFRNTNPNLIHIHQLNRFALVIAIVAKKLKIPLIATAWGSDVLLIPKQNKFYYLIIKYILKNSKVVTADSMQMIQAIKQIYSDCKTKTCIYGIDPIKGGNKEQIFYTNRLHAPLYRNDLIIDLFKRFLLNNPGWKLIIGGDGEQTNMLKSKVQKLNIQQNVEFTGWLEKHQNDDWYGRAKFYISLPESDGTSISLLEAMSAGCVPILSDLPVSYEWVKNGENGIICNLKKESPFDDVLKIDFEKASAYNAKLILDSYTREKSGEKFYNLYVNNQSI